MTIDPRLIAVTTAILADHQNLDADDIIDWAMGGSEGGCVVLETEITDTPNPIKLETIRIVLNGELFGDDDICRIVRSVRALDLDGASVQVCF